MLEKVLIANRGEIACRVIATCQRLGIATVAVYSDADADARHVRLADEAVHIGPAPAVHSYLDIERIVTAAHTTHAVAIHPGYGFLSENAGFAHACADADIVFIGPGAQTIAAMGSKAESKRLMQEAGVPTIPGYHDARQDDATLLEQAHHIGLPLLVKASAGGGGKGMRIVRNAEHLSDALSAARREAKSAFGDDRLILERYLERPRHIEFQVFGDHHGNLVHLFERECSVQRRYQKVFEESPSPFVDASLREQMGNAALAAARAVRYTNAGTVEFIVDQQRNFYFLEMNTRLQVEHPVTELVTGQDLVEWQLRVAAGQPLPLTQDQLALHGHAIEARIYAEDPGRGFLPSTGRIARFVVPTGNSVRLDSGYEDNDTVSMHYDPMLAKLICHAEDRNTALSQLRHALAHTALFGPTTNLDLLRRLAADPVFTAGDADTGYLDRELDAVLTSTTPGTLVLAAAAVAEVMARERKAQFARSPWERADGWQANRQSRVRLAMQVPGSDSVSVLVRGRDGHYSLDGIGDEVIPLRAYRSGAEQLVVESGSDSAAVTILRHANTLQVVIGDRATRVQLTDPYPAAELNIDDVAHPGSPMPGTIVAVKVKPGDQVREGQPLVVLEGMKMEVTVAARINGTVLRVLYDVGDNVEAETPLVELEAASR